jgi:uncharacterized glyoxalase superfamily protein PhnB
MPNVQKLTPNLLVSKVEQSLAFYEGVLGFARGMTVPDQPPFAFASVTSGPVEIFFNDHAMVAKESPATANLAIGGGNTMFIEIADVDAFHESIKDRVKVLIPLVTQWYGMREFTIADPDGYVITFAERVERQST